MERMKLVAEKVEPERTIRLLRDLIMIPSPTGEEEKIATFVSQVMKDYGFDLVQVDQYWNVLGSVKGSSIGPTLLLLTHLDSGTPGTMKEPFSAEIKDGKEYGKKGIVVYGHGATAPKSSIAAILESVRALIDWGRENWGGTIKVACVTKDLMANHDGVKELHESFGLHSDFVIAGEPSNNQAIIEARGISCIQITLKGIETHRGRPKEGVNPLYGLADVLHIVENCSLPQHAILGPATVSAFEVSSKAQSPNTPSSAIVAFDRRLLPGETVENILSDFQNILQLVTQKRKGLIGNVQQIRSMYSFSTQEDSPVVEALYKAGKVITGQDIGTAHISFSSNVGFVVNEIKIPGVAFGPGRIEDAGDQEHVEVDKVIEAARIIAAACLNIMDRFQN